MKLYSGTRYGDGGQRVQVQVEEGKRITTLNPRNDLWNHSPDGFQWGYGGSGPAQLALALLVDATGDDRLAVRLHQPFKWQFVASLGDSWTMTEDEIMRWIKSYQQEEGASA
jgi:hypothetical protein